MLVTIVAKITGAVQAGSYKDKEGLDHSKCTLTLQTLEAKPHNLAVNVVDELTQWANRQGQTVEVTFYVLSHEYEGRWYTEARATTIKAVTIA